MDGPDAGAAGPTGATPDDAPRAALGWAILFAVPVGVGVAAAVMRMTGAGPLDPVVALPGLLTAAGVFALVALASATGSPEGGNV